MKLAFPVLKECNNSSSSCKQTLKHLVDRSKTDVSTAIIAITVTSQ